MATRNKWAVALLALFAVGCRSEGTNELTIKAFGMEFAIIDKTMPNSEGKDIWARGVDRETVDIIRSIIRERRESRAKDEAAPTEETEDGD